ncbi:MAG: hypothetical protein COA91_07110 [Robiginitomaculum sp.]|nr:MAG: hypothetical protein COA91_07110 [Robiginitomaculum sp.]
MSNRTKEQSRSNTATIAAIVPMIVIYGAFYTFGKSVIFGEVYFSTLTYSDTLIQFFLTLVWLLVTIAFFSSIALILILIISTIVFLLGGFLRRRYSLKLQEQTKTLQKTKMDISMSVKRISEIEIKMPTVMATITKREKSARTIEDWQSLATDMEDINKDITKLKSMKQVTDENYQEVVLLQKSNSELKIKLNISFRDHVNNVVNEMKDEETIWKIPHTATLYFFGILLLTGIINFFYIFFWFGQTPIAMVLLILIILPLWASLFFTQKFKLPPAKTDLSIDNLFLIILFICSLIFALAKGYDDARYNLKFSKTYEIITEDRTIEGRIIDSNKQYLLVYSDDTLILINRNESKEIRLSNHK